MRILRLTPAQYDEFGPRIAALEHGVTYPLGADRFEIRHGDDYFAFFRRLGELTYFVALEDARIVGVLAAVLRVLPARKGSVRAWYLCDLKAFGAGALGVAPALLASFEEYSESQGVGDSYAISMNGANGENRLARVVARWWQPPPLVAGRLQLYSCDADSMRQVAPLLATALEPARYLSLAGVKDIVLASTGKPMPLLHVQHGPLAAAGRLEPVGGAVHMFCLLDSEVRNAEIRRFGWAPSATATVFVRSPMDLDFRFVLTSDI